MAFLFMCVFVFFFVLVSVSHFKDIFDDLFLAHLFKTKSNAVVS